MEPKVPNESITEIEIDIQAIEHLLSRFQDLHKISEIADKDDHHSVSYINGKNCALLKGINAYIAEHHLIDADLHAQLMSMLESLENDIDFFNTHEKVILEKGERILSVLSKRAVYVHARRISDYILTLTFLLLLRLKGLKIEIEEKMVLLEQGKKLKEMLEEQRKESLEKVSRYTV